MTDHTLDNTNTPGSSPAPDTGQTMSIPVIEEFLTIDKRLVETGIVRVSKKVFDEPQTITIPLSQTEYVIDHVAINQYVDEAPAPMRQVGDTTIIPVLREVLVVEKRLMLVEEIHLTRKQSTAQQTQEITLRREEIIIERLTDNGLTS